ncbi:hypothetical protein G4B88_010647 [Cannabis sativa]|uniref:Uncharacterized protein n=1 Tax=Cannabis sativa TaxID=3483 RepID=A0A7J6G8G4_CANSA|nr:hypothetical protein G4B88_010647 [Cannabis sativa]
MTSLRRQTLQGQRENKIGWDLKIPNLVRTASRNKHSLSNLLLKCPRFNAYDHEKHTFFFNKLMLDKRIDHELGGRPNEDKQKTAIGMPELLRVLP